MSINAVTPPLAVDVKSCYNYITTKQLGSPFDHRTHDDRDRR
jgi:hypothetical protein